MEMALSNVSACPPKATIKSFMKAELSGEPGTTAQRP